MPMIATLEGKISEKLKDQIVVDVNGVGYGVYVSLEDYGRLERDEVKKIYIYEHVREQAHDLFGFIERDTQNLFEQLLDVNGVGPKMALNLLSIGNTSEVRQAIAEGNLKFLQTASGVGRRVAERIVIELKNKVGLSPADLDDTAIFKSETSSMKDEAVEALISLGFDMTDATKVLKDVDPNLPTEERIKLALRKG
jgi:Holliday junction DNA helicase RuvA